MKSKFLVRKLFSGSPLVLSLAFPFIGSQSAQAASATWNGTTDATWATPTNWSANPVPGTGDTATFNNAGGVVDTIDLGAGVTLRTLLFDTAAAEAYTIGSGAVGSQTLNLEAAGAITMNATVAANQLINANLKLGSAAANEAFSITNNSASSLTLAGAVSATTTGTKTLTVGGTGATIATGNLTGGTGTLALVKSGAGILTLSGTNSFSAVNFSGVGANQGLNGAIRVTSNDALGSAVVTMNGQNATTQTLELANNVTISNNISSRSRDIGRAWISNVSGNNTYSGTVDVTATGGGVTFESVSGKLTLSGSFSSSTGTTNREIRLQGAGDGEITAALNSPVVGSVTKTGAGTWTLSSTNTFTGAVSITAGKIVVGTGGSVANTTLTQVGVTNGSSGVLEINGGSYNANLGTNNYDASINVGTVSGAPGELKLVTGSLTTKKQLALGNNGATGTYTQTGGTASIGGFLAMGLGSGIGIYNQSGGTASVAQGTIGAGGTGSGTISLSGNASLTNTGGAGFELWLGEAGSGTLDVSDTAQLTHINSNLILGRNNVATAKGTVNLNGGTILAKGISKSGALATGTFNFDGGTLKASEANANFMTGLTSAVVKGNGGTVDNGSFNITIGQALLVGTGGGGMKFQGAGVTTLNGTNTYTGATTITNGTLALGAGGSIANSSTIDVQTGTTLDTTAQSGWALATGQTLKGTGTVDVGATNTLTIGTGASLAAGASPGTLDITGSLAFAANSTFSVEIAPGTPTSDKVNVGGGLVIDPTASLALSLFGSDTILPDGTKFVVVDYATTWNGTAFSGFADDTNTTFGANTYLVDYDDASLGGTAMTLTVVPEPTALLLGSLGLLGLLRRRR